ncbi:unnamed protein product [Trifolium pratense]|uniref:Uncharacterized protein n=1 Tax=Trifolium pratense TaxID=57577 RepID=A0ACB0IXS6_TRIPR|nr:unnamed protein product [Trifolium pratense]
MSIENDEDKLNFQKVLNFYFVDQFFICSSDTKKVRNCSWTFVDDFEKYNWPKLVFDHICESLAELKEKRKDEADRVQQLVFKGCAPVLEALIFERIAVLQPKLNLHSDPPLQKYGSKRFESLGLCRILDAMDANQITPCPWGCDRQDTLLEDAEKDAGFSATEDAGVSGLENATHGLSLARDVNLRVPSTHSLAKDVEKDAGFSATEDAGVLDIENATHGLSLARDENLRVPPTHSLGKDVNQAAEAAKVNQPSKQQKRSRQPPKNKSHVGDANAVAGDAVAYIKKRKKKVGGDAAVVAGLDDTDDKSSHSLIHAYFSNIRCILVGPQELQFDPEIEKTARAIRKATREAQASRGTALLRDTPDCQERTAATMEEEQVPPVPQPPRRTLGDYGRRDNDALANQGFQPANPVSFDIKNTVLSALKENPYSGSEAQCPNLHLSHFYEACDYTDPPGVSESDKRLRLFKHSLTGRAKDWLDTIPAGTIETWRQLERKFLDRYFPIHKFLERRAEISNFEQADGETLYDAWERFKVCLKRCPNHGFDGHNQMQMFTQGLRAQTRMILDASAGGSLKNRDETEARELVESMAQNEYRATNDRGAKKKGGVLELDTQTALLAQQKLMTSQMEAMMKLLSNPQVQSSPIGGFGGNTHDNPKNETCNGITLRSREIPERPAVEKPLKKKVNEGEVENKQEVVVENERYEGEVEKESMLKEVEISEDEKEEVEKQREIKEKEGKKVEKGKGVDESPYARMPFPRRKKVKNLEREKEFKKFMKVLNKLEMAIPLVEALEQMPSYAKFLKELLTKKRKPLDDEMVSMTEECSALIQRKLPQKKKDPGSFTIPCSIGTLTIEKALCDLGASINLMPLSMMKKIPGAVAKPTKMSLSLADRSVVHPEGILHDVLVKVAGFVFPADFVVLDIEETREWEPLLLGRPFLATSRALIDVEMGELMLRTDDQQVTFNVFDKMECDDGDPQCFKIQMLTRLTGKGKKKSDANPPQEPPKKPRTKMSASKGQSSRSAQASPPRRSNVTRPQVHPHFISEIHEKRYSQIRTFTINQEKGFGEDLLNGVAELGNEIKSRGWEKFNKLMIKDEVNPGNQMWAREFFANAYLPDQPMFPEYISVVRGVKVSYSFETINNLLGCAAGGVCELLRDRERIDKSGIEVREELKSIVCRPGAMWLAHSAASLPRRLSLTSFNPVHRAWGEFWLKNVRVVGNNSEIQLDNAHAVRLLVEGKYINLGYWLQKDLHEIANHPNPTFTLGHCNLIAALCRANNVPMNVQEGDLHPVRPLSLSYFIKKFERGPIVPRGEGNAAREEALREEEEINRFEEGNHPDQQGDPAYESHDIPAQDPPRYSHDMNQLASMLHQMEISQYSGLPNLYFDTASSMYTEAMTYRSTFPPPTFGTLYPVDTDWEAHQARELTSFQARQAYNSGLRASELAEIERRRRVEQDEAAAMEREMLDVDGLNLNLNSPFTNYFTGQPDDAV